MESSQDKIRIPVPSKDELESLDIVHLAIMCLKVADDPSVAVHTAQKASALRQSWMNLVMSETSPLLDYKERDAIQKQKAELRNTMIDFLSTA
jgi:dGTP triphosphohydrolase